MPLRSTVFALALFAAGPAVAEETWRPLDAANTLVITTDRGAIITELRSEFAPLAVARIKLLAREGVYDGLLFHRVIDGFVAQTGNPNNKDGGVSAHPDLAPEFMFRLEPTMAHVIATHASDGIGGFVGASAFAGEALAVAARNRRPVRAWGLYCAGVLGMGRQEALNTANSEIFFMREPARRLDRNYTVVGTVVAGLDVVRALTVGEPPAKPDRMIRARIVEDMPASERPRLEVMNVGSAEFKKLIDQTRATKGADFSPCDITVPVREIR